MAPSVHFSPFTRGWLSRLVPIGLLGLLAGCALQDAPKNPEILNTTATELVIPKQWAEGVSSEGEVVVNWPDSFQDPQLNELIQQALAYNTNLQAAEARMQQAASGVAVAGSALYPNLAGDGKAGTHLGGANGGLRGWLVSSTWELDVWGRVRYGRRAAMEEYVSAQYDIAYARQSLVAEVATGWFLAKQARQQTLILENVIKASEELVEIAKTRWDVGSGNEQDYLTAKASINEFRSELEQTRLAYKSAVRALEVLVGHYPAAQLDVTPELPDTLEPIPTGLPAELLDRRPDILAAERNVASKFNLVGSARAARLPKINLTAAVASLSSNFYQLQNISDPLINVGANLIAPIYMGGELQARQEGASAQQREAMAQYATAVLNAFKEVETTLNTLETLEQQSSYLNTVVDDTSRTLKLAELQYEVGQTGMYYVTQLQVDLSEAQLNLLSVRTQACINRVQLHLVLGGDFGMPETDEEAIDGPANPFNISGLMPEKSTAQHTPDTQEAETAPTTVN
ncbi:TolC family protein [Ruficoccus sp. ZRK36]|uniref:TolC family protein n=1 Tax=Ruficoccus sp. ZRK36 TaxID=2866311 RepID=UPI001C7398FB|nr:TolC family protein [Ruficoccus sp. ZRK36]QYY36880.1 TolC family protein [Ruficoccus sp. ZRK36]